VQCFLRLHIARGDFPVSSLTLTNSFAPSEKVHPRALRHAKNTTRWPWHAGSTFCSSRSRSSPHARPSSSGPPHSISPSPLSTRNQSTQMRDPLTSPLFFSRLVPTTEARIKAIENTGVHDLEKWWCTGFERRRERPRLRMNRRRKGFPHLRVPPPLTRKGA